MLLLLSVKLPVRYELQTQAGQCESQGTRGAQTSSGSWTSADSKDPEMVVPCCTYTFVVFVNINSFCELDTPDTEDEVSHDPDVPSTVAVDTGNVHSSGDIVAVDGTGIHHILQFATSD